MSIKKNAEESQKGRVEWEVLKKFFLLFKPDWKLVTCGGGLILAISLLQLPGPFLSQYLIDHSLPGKDEWGVILISSIIFGLLISKSILSTVNRYILAKFRENFLMNIKLSFFHHIISLPISFFKQNDATYTLTRLNNDTTETEGVFADNMLALVSNLVTFAVGISALYYIHWRLALISSFMLPFYVIAGYIFGKKIQRQAPIIQENAAQCGWHIGDSLLGIFMIKTMAREDYVEEKLGGILTKQKKDNLKMSIFLSLNDSAGLLVGGMGSLAVLCFGIIEIINGRLTLGKLVAFNAFLGYLYSPLSGLMGVSAKFRRSVSAMKRIIEIIDNSTEFEEESLNVCGEIKGSLLFKDVTFGYSKKVQILDGINLDIKKGELIAIVGRSGAGKSTLVNLIPRLYEPTGGEIWLDGKKLGEYPRKVLREAIGYVPQDTFLFKGTIRDNIRIANPAAKDEELEEAVRAAGIDFFLEKLSLDLDADVGVLGSKLSGGQKQLISIARILIKKTRILIFDEATAHLDFETEHMLKKAIEKVVKGRTTIIIAHRLTTVLNASKIIALENGKIVGVGTHDQLYDTNPFYRDIFDRQFLGDAN